MSNKILKVKSLNSRSTISFLQNNFDRLFIASDGKIGINTNSPSKLLTVNGNLIIDGIARLNSLISSGNIKIRGTAQMLDAYFNNISVHSNISYSGSLLNLYTNYGSTSIAAIHPTGDTDTGIVFLNSNSTNALRFITGGSDRLKIDTSGYVGNSSDSPTTALDITGEVVALGGFSGPNLYGYRYHQTLYYTSSSTFNKASYPWLTAIRVICVGGGGGGGGSGITLETQVGTGGGGGGTCIRTLAVASIPAGSISVTVGAGGATGATGGTTSFGSLCSATGGLLGILHNYSSASSGNTSYGASPILGNGNMYGGVGNVGDLGIYGSAGKHASYMQGNLGLAAVSEGLGGDSSVGFAGGSYDGDVGGRFGAGGKGGMGGYAENGSPGRAGLVILELYA